MESIGEASANRARLISIGKFERVLVEGSTDPSGYSKEFAMEISERRAQVVEDALVKNKIPRAFISATGHGTDQLLVPTQRSTEREPRDRNAEIIIVDRWRWMPDWIAKLLCAGWSGCLATQEERAPCPTPPTRKSETVPTEPVKPYEQTWDPGYWHWDGSDFAWRNGAWARYDPHGPIGWLDGYWRSRPTGSSGPCVWVRAHSG
jgi:hypothetical protein